METKVLITIDTEPDNQWDAHLRRNPQFKNIYALPRLQSLFDRFLARPTYLVAFSVAKNDAVGALKEIAKSCACEIGAHLHAWETPPYEPQLKGTGTYLHQYAYALQCEKLENLDRLIQEVFGKKPVSYRAGRYSFDSNTVRLLVNHGYLADTSVTPGISWEGDGGTNFKKYGLRDHFFQGEKTKLLEVPVSIKIKARLRGLSELIYLNTPNWTHAEGILRRVARFNIIWLDPSFNSFADMKYLADTLLAQGLSHLNIMFHSSAIVAGGSPYTMDQESRDNFFRNLEMLLEYLLKVRGLQAMTLKDYYAWRNV